MRGWLQMAGHVHMSRYVWTAADFLGRLPKSSPSVVARGVGSRPQRYKLGWKVQQISVRLVS